MIITPSHEFLRHAQSLGVIAHPTLENPHYLTLGHHDHARFWVIPSPPRRIPFFITHILNGLDPWQQITVWPRRGRWVETFDAHNIHGEVYRSISIGTGLPPSTEGALTFSRENLEPLITIVFAHLIFGWSLPDDLYLLPDHARQLVHTDHHDVVHVQFLEPKATEVFIEHMCAKRFELPDDLPDQTFKRPQWMK